MSIIQRVPWTVQPQGAVGVDWGNPIARGLKSALNPSTGKDALSPVWTVGGTGLTKATTSKGAAYTSTGSGRVTANAHILDDAGPFTALFLVSGSASTGMVLSATGGGNNFGTNGANWYFWAIAGGTSIGSSTVGVYDAITIVRTASNASAYKNGNLAATGVWNGGLTGNTLLMNRGDNAVPSASNLALFLAWDRELSAAEVDAISANPWQLFAPQTRRIWVPVSAGGAADGNASTTPASSTLAAPAATGSGSAQASTAPAGSTLIAPTATASASALASGALAGVGLTAPTGTATGSAQASAAPAASSLTAPQATATGTTAGNATGTGTVAGVALAAPTGTAVGTAADGSASGSIAGLTLTAPTATASNGLVPFVGGGWDELASLRKRRNKQDQIAQTVEAEIVKAVESIPAQKIRKTITLADLVGKQAAMQISTADARRMKRKRDDELLLLM